MNARTLSAILIKTLGLFFAVNALAGLGVLVVNILAPRTMGSPGLASLYAIRAVIYLLELAVSFIFLAHTSFVLDVYYRDLPPDSGTGDTRGTYQTMAVALVGIWIVAAALPSLLARGSVALYLLDARRQSAFPDWWLRNGTETLSAAFSTIVGLVLFKLRGKISASWTNPPPAPESKISSDESAS